MVMEHDHHEGKKGGYTSWSYQKVLTEGLLPIYNNTRIFQQENAKIHKSPSTMDWLLNHSVELLEDWPAHSPDLNPIKHVWALLKRKIKELYPDIWELKKNQINIGEFTRVLQEMWEKIDQADIDRLIESMPRRLAAVKKARGWYTKY